MADPFLGEISIVGINFAPDGWAFCDGQQMMVIQQSALFSLLGTAFGGDGKTYFNLPDLRGQAPVGTSNNYGIGLRGGSDQVALTMATMPFHTHTFYGINAPGTKNGPGTNRDRMLANDDNTVFFSSDLTDTVLLPPDSCSPAGANGAHNNIQPSLVLNFIIALEGAYPA
ncbi:MAG: tail fiber protein [Victivallaceae bacterium]|nr:tail fiber protein [Victivallaceae bacterium]